MDSNAQQSGFAASSLAAACTQLTIKDILEQAGISWPIRNPLYLPSTSGSTASAGLASPRITIPYPKAHDFGTNNHTRSPLARQSQPAFSKPRNFEPYARPRTDPPQFTQLHKPPARGHTTFEPCNSTYDDMSVDSWPMRQTSSHTPGDSGMLDVQYMTSGFGHAEYPWRPTDSQHDYDQAKNHTNSQARQENNNRQVVVTLRDDQLGQIVRL